MPKRKYLIFFLTLCLGWYSCKYNNSVTLDKGDWSEYLGGADRNHYAALNQIDTANVDQLQVAWEYHSGDSGQVQCNPIIIDGILYGLTASNHVFALHATTGIEIWRNNIGDEFAGNVNRGVTYWEDKDKEDKRILFAYGEWLTCLDAANGKVITSFGDQGRISLKAGLGDGIADKYVGSTTPGALFEDFIIMPIRVGEGEGAAPGHIQAFNVKTGELVWVFHTIPKPGEAGYDTWPKGAYSDKTIGGANNWAGMAIDHQREMIYIPTGSPAFDFYGANRLGQNLYGNSLLALDVRTGSYKWHFQTVHHDIWDRDLPAPPNLLTVRHEGKMIDVVAQVTKTGFVFVFDRENGRPLFPIEERPFLNSNVPGEETWPTQPVPVLPKPFARQDMEEGDISVLAQNREELLGVFRASNSGFYHPLAVDKNHYFVAWCRRGCRMGGAAVDPDGILYINANEMPWLFSLTVTKVSSAHGKLSEGNVLYNRHCVSCHGKDLKGSETSGFPSLVAVNERMKQEDILRLIDNGKGMMPGFSHVNAIEKQAIIDFISGSEKTEITESIDLSELGVDKGPFQFNGYHKFLDNRGFPAISPPWGTLTAIDLNTGNHLWKVPLGEFKELIAEGASATGTENYGGPVVTAGGLLFIAATKDGMFRAFNKTTGKLLWQKELPAAGFATPSTYQVDGKQYIVMACGGTKLGVKKGDSYIAFSLP